VLTKRYCRLILAALLLAWSAAAPARAEVVNGVKAVVHTSVITYGEIESDVMMLAEDYRRQYIRQPAVFQQKIEAALKDSFDNALKHQMILRDFESSGYNLPESYIEEIVAAEVKRYGGRTTLTKTLQARGITYEKWRQKVKDQFLVGQLRNQNINRETIISPYKIQAYYNEHKDSYQVAEQVKLRMIMLNKPADEAELEGAKELAQQVLEKLKGGAAFSEMASIYSQGTQRSQGGDWGWAERSVLRSELADLAFNLKPGELSDVIETPQAYFIMLVEDKRASHVKPITEVREEIENLLGQQERTRLEAKYVEKLKKKTFIRKFDY
jgi:peptidyl-prolyl cis-trans isomerase SurA